MPPTTTEINGAIYALLSERAHAEGREFSVSTIMELYDVFRFSKHFLARRVNSRSREFMFQHTRAILDGKEERPAEGTYRNCIVRLLLGCVGFSVGLEEQEDDEFCDLVYAACLRLVAHDRVPANIEYIQTCPRLFAEYTRAQEEHSGNKRHTTVKNYVAMCGILGSLPSVETVRIRVGTAEAEEWKNALDVAAASHVEDSRPCGYVDVDSALEVGESTKWTATTAKKKMHLFSMYVETLDRTAEEVDEMYARWKKGMAQERLASSESARAEAAALGVWRPRPVDEPRWCAALTPEEWREYVQLDTALKSSLRSGVYQFIPRRHLTSESVAEMRSVILPALRARVCAPVMQ